VKVTIYGITLRRITIDDIELVRVKRNEVRAHMEYRAHITPEKQLEWFRSIDNINNFYYIIEHNNEQIGLISEKDISREESGGMESGIFLFDKKYHNSIYPVAASLILIEGGFYLFKTGDSYIHVLKNNSNAIAYNKTLGYVLCEGQESVENQKYVLTKENFEKKAGKIRKAVLQLCGGDNSTTVVIERHDYKNGVGQLMEGVMKPLNVKPDIRENGDKVYYLNWIISG
jgi:hypothetical protein